MAWPEKEIGGGSRLVAHRPARWSLARILASRSGAQFLCLWPRGEDAKSALTLAPRCNRRAKSDSSIAIARPATAYLHTRRVPSFRQTRMRGDLMSDYANG